MPVSEKEVALPFSSGNALLVSLCPTFSLRAYLTCAVTFLCCLQWWQLKHLTEHGCVGSWFPGACQSTGLHTPLYLCLRGNLFQAASCRAGWEEEIRKQHLNSYKILLSSFKATEAVTILSLHCFLLLHSFPKELLNSNAE